MADSIRHATSCHFQVFYWPYDVNLWDGTIPLLSVSPRHRGGSALTRRFAVLPRVLSQQFAFRC